MKNVLLGIATILSAFVSHAQSVSYSVLENDPDHIKKVSLAIDPFYTEIYGGINFATIGAAVRAEALLWKRLELKADVRVAYLDGNIKAAGTGGTPAAGGLYTMVPDHGTKRTNYYEVGGAFYLINRTRQKNLSVTLHSSSSGRYTYRTSMKVPTYRRRMFGVRGGLAVYNTGMEITGDHLPYFSFKDKQGNSLLPYSGYAPIYAYTMVNSTLFYAGLSLKSICNLIISADGYGTKKRSGVYDVYIDAITTPYVKLKDINDGIGNTYKVTPQDSAKKFIGWRFGVTYRSVNKVGFTYKFEIGERPGLYFGEKDKLINGNVNALLAIGFNIPFIKRGS